MKVVFLIVPLAAVLAACSSSEPASENRPDQPELSELEELYWARIENSRSDFTEADVKFMTGMIGHHAQALIMSRLAPENNASPSIQTLASRIINAQKDEIASMQKWLRDRGQPVPEIHIDGLDLMIMGLGEHHSMHHQDMPGMLSREQLSELASLQGKEFDRQFLTFMIEHHQGAVIMVENLFAADGAALDEEAFRLASDIQVDQKTEIERMNLMLQNMTD